MSTAMPIWCWGKAAVPAAGRAAPALGTLGTLGTLGKGCGSAGSGPGLRGHNTNHAHTDGSGPALPSTSTHSSNLQPHSELGAPRIYRFENNVTKMVGLVFLATKIQFFACTLST